jgi:outer membrane protein TolC
MGATLRWTLLAGMWAAAMCATSAAQISLGSAVGMALRSDPRMKMAEADVDKARAAISETRDAFIPSLGANAGVGYSIGVPLSLPVIFSVSSESLLINFSQKDYMRSAHAGLQASVFALQEAHDKVAEDVAVTYLNLDTAERREAALQQEYGFAKTLTTIIGERVDAGQDDRMELLRGRRTADQIHLQELQAEEDVATLSDHLARLMGMPGTPFRTVPESIPAMPAPNAFVVDGPVGFGVQSAFADAKSKEQKAVGDMTYRLRPQMAFGLNYSRISTDFTNYTDYYPAFRNNKSDNAFSIGVQVRLPVYDRAHDDRAHEAAADAMHARALAEDSRNQFLEGRLKLRRSTEELQARTELATDDRDIAQADLEAVRIRLKMASGGTDQPQTNPKDEENARIQEQAKEIDLLDAEAQLRQVEVNLMRQTGTLSDWLRSSIAAPSGMTANPVSHE